MKKVILCAACFGFSLFLPNMVSADCISIAGFDRFSLQGLTVFLYSGSIPVARFDAENCAVRPSSKIVPLKTDVCDGDEIMIDGSRCVMMDVKSLGP